jgi:hypothetical protein
MRFFSMPTKVSTFVLDLFPFQNISLSVVIIAHPIRKTPPGLVTSSCLDSDGPKRKKKKRGLSLTMNEHIPGVPSFCSFSFAFWSS